MARPIRLGLLMALMCCVLIVTIASQFGGSVMSSGTVSSKTHLEIHQVVERPTPIRYHPTSIPLTHIHAARSRPVRTVLPVRASVKPLVVHVQPGQCLWQLAQIYHTSITAIEGRNDLHNNVLQIGQRLIIPHTQKSRSLPKSSSKMLTYHVHSGDSLWRIAETFGVSIQSLRALNNVSGNLIRDGQVLRIAPIQTRHQGTPASHALIQSAPQALIPVYQAAGRKYDIPWTVLAAIHKQETDFGTSGYDVSSAGAIGPMQFMPSTFAIFGVAAPGHQTADIHNVDDAIYSAAHMLHVEGFQSNPYDAIYAYNHSSTYVADILHMSAV